MPADRLEAAAEQRAGRDPVANRDPALALALDARPAQIRLCVPVEELVRPGRRGLEGDLSLTEPHGAQVPVRIGQDSRELSELRDEGRPVERRETRAARNRPVEHGHVRVALEDLWVRPDQVEVEQRQQLVRVVATDAREHDGDVLVEEGRVQVLDPGLGRCRDPTLAPGGVRHHPNPQVEGFEVRGPALDPMGPQPHRAERRRDDRDGVARPDTTWARQLAHGTLRSS